MKIFNPISKSLSLWRKCLQQNAMDFHVGQNCLVLRKRVSTFWVTTTLLKQCLQITKEHKKTRDCNPKYGSALPPGSEKVVPPKHNKNNILSLSILDVEQHIISQNRELVFYRLTTQLVVQHGFTTLHCTALHSTLLTAHDGTRTDERSTARCTAPVAVTSKRNDRKKRKSTRVRQNLA